MTAYRAEMGPMELKEMQAEMGPLDGLDLTDFPEPPGPKETLD